VRKGSEGLTNNPKDDRIGPGTKRLVRLQSRALPAADSGSDASKACACMGAWGVAEYF